MSEAGRVRAACVFPGRGARVPSYPVRIDAGEVWLEMPPGGAAPC